MQMLVVTYPRAEGVHQGTDRFWLGSKGSPTNITTRVAHWRVRIPVIDLPGNTIRAGRIAKTPVYILAVTPECIIYIRESRYVDACSSGKGGYSIPLVGLKWNLNPVDVLLRLEAPAHNLVRIPGIKTEC